MKSFEAKRRMILYRDRFMKASRYASLLEVTVRVDLEKTIVRSSEIIRSEAQNDFVSRPFYEAS